MSSEQPKCAECGCERDEHIKFIDAEGGYCHACWFNGDITDEAAMKRSEHLFVEKGPNKDSAGPAKEDE